MMLLAAASFLLCHVVAGEAPFQDGKGGHNKTVRANNNPYIVSIQVENEEVCGGSILASSIILSAAHCISKYSPEKLSIGNHSVVEIKIHERYENVSGTLLNDVALLWISPPLKFSSQVASVDLSNKRNAVPKYDSKVASDVGFVVKFEKGGIVGRLDLPISDRAQCARDHRNHSGAWASLNNRICTSAATGTSGICLADLSGDPLLIGSRQIGIRSRGLGCGGPRESEIYVDVSLYIDWIDRNVERSSMSDATQEPQKINVEFESGTDDTLRKIYEFFKFWDPQGKPFHRG